MIEVPPPQLYVELLEPDIMNDPVEESPVSVHVPSGSPASAEQSKLPVVGTVEVPM